METEQDEVTQPETTAETDQGMEGKTETPAEGIPVGENPAEEQTETPAEGQTETPARENPAAEQTETSAEGNPAGENPTEEQTETPAEEQTETPAEGQTETPAGENPAEGQTETPAEGIPAGEDPTEKQTETLAEEQTETLAEEQTETLAEGQTETLAEGQTEAPAAGENPAGEQTETPAEETPAEETPAEGQIETPAEETPAEETQAEGQTETPASEEKEVPHHVADGDEATVETKQTEEEQVAAEEQIDNSNNNAGEESGDPEPHNEDAPKDQPTQETEEQEQKDDCEEQKEDGAEQKEDGAEQKEDGTEQKEDGAEQKEDGAEQKEDGTEQKEDGTEQKEDGTEQQYEELETARTEPEQQERGQQMTPKTTSAQSVEIPAPAVEDAEEEAYLEDKKTPEPSTENMGTGMEQVEEYDAGGAVQPVEPEAQVSSQHVAPSPVPQYDHSAAATVKFVLMPTQQVATLRCNLSQTLYDLKEHFAQELKIPASSILLMLDGKGTVDRMTLGELGVGPNGTIRLEMQSADPENKPIKAFKPRQDYTMPDVISVRVASAGVVKDIVVEIERSNRKKPFLGGYRHKKTNVEYHHAAAQTMQKQRPPPAVERYCRDTQTVQEKHMVQQTTNDMSTQMTKIGVYMSNMPDKLLVPGTYTTADDFKMNMLQQVIIIQKYYRRWLAKRYVENVRDDQEKRVEWERQEELRKKKEKEDRIRREFERRMNPKSKEDFDLLFHALEKWRNEEMNYINETLSGAERKAALCQLLDQETQLISSIGRHKLEADTENKQKHIQAFLDKAASAKKWKGPDGKQTEMDTPYTIRAQELRDIYNSINMKYLTQDERLDVLLTLKHTVKEHDCKLTQEVIELIDREADLLMRGTKESNLEGLRKRISTLFLQYIKTPTFNPEAARLLKVPQDPSTLRKNIYFCSSCNLYLPSTEFQLSSNSRAVGKCRKCNKMDNDARVRQDHSHYRFMLKSIRMSEDSYGDSSKIAFLMQENDLRYLVENVWNSQSILSAWDDLYDLVLVRWDRHQEWSPWNSILITKEESTAHEKLEHLNDAYGKVFSHKVKHKHTLARNYFSRMPGMAEHMRGSSRNNSAQSNGPSISGNAIAPAQA